MTPEDGAVPAVRHYPQERARDRGMELEGDADGIEEIAIAEDDQRLGADYREQRRREIHVAVIRRKSSCLPDERTNLIFAVDVTPAHRPALGFRQHLLGEVC